MILYNRSKGEGNGKSKSVLLNDEDVTPSAARVTTTLSLVTKT